MTSANSSLSTIKAQVLAAMLILIFQLRIMKMAQAAWQELFNEVDFQALLQGNSTDNTAAISAVTGTAAIPKATTEQTSMATAAKAPNAATKTKPAARPAAKQPRKRKAAESGNLENLEPEGRRKSDSKIPNPEKPLAKLAEMPEAVVTHPIDYITHALNEVFASEANSKEKRLEFSIRLRLAIDIVTEFLRKNTSPLKIEDIILLAKDAASRAGMSLLD